VFFKAIFGVPISLGLMRTFLKTIVIFVIALVFFFIGAVTAGARHWFQPIATVIIKNGTSQNLTELIFSFESASIHSTANLPPLSAGQSKTVRFFVAGEGSYSIEARLPNSNIVKGGAGYVESGYSTVETITESGIKSDVSFIGF